MAERQIKISVRNFVEFMLRNGDIDNRKHVSSENAMVEGGRIHRMIQRRMGSEYEAEVFLKYEEETPKYKLIIDGRADGIITVQSPQLTIDTNYEVPAVMQPFIVQEQVTIDEIKGTYRELDRIKKPEPVHLAQAKVYAYIYGKKKTLETICVRMTYCNMDTEELKYFIEEYTLAELEEWFLELVTGYKKWAEFQIDWREKRQESIKKVSFPYMYRKGQKELAVGVYRTIYHKRKLFLEAPTGVGKTLSTVFPAVKALGEELGERIFYLTAKTITRTAASQGFELLRQKGLVFKTVILTAKEKICFVEECECNPVACPYAKGHFDRINDAIFEIITHEDCFDRETVEKYAKKHQVCPFELALDCSLFADGIIGDYNYLFDPHVYLKRFFADGNQSKGIFLVDEAHNLVDRGRDMYSAVLVKEDFLELKKHIKPYSSKMEKQLEKCNRELLLLKRETEGVKQWESIESFVLALNRLSSTVSEYLENHDDSPVRDKVLEFYFEISHFLLMYDGMSDDYVMYTQMGDEGNFFLKLFCVNPAKKLRACMEKGVSSILFSATLIPVQYYKKLLGGTKEDYEVYADSAFDSSKRALLIGNDVTSKYTRRNEDEYLRIASYIENIISERHGNYMVFFPSYSMMEKIYGIYRERFNWNDEVECILQKDSMSEEEREDFLKHFMESSHLNIQDKIKIPIESEEKSLVGFCVLGGIFSEGIDLKQDSLIGAIIVGTGLPLVCPEREILKNYFDNEEGNGFDYAYRYPGMNKVLQAAGRVIRTNEDVGVVALLDERFLQNSYTRLFPREWVEYKIVQETTVAKQVEKFWNEWL
ncbi:MAG: ATP-dependent DNA helicase [Lachnospiraceae bacterium]|nr:ATP-dependent DNA helicase [Lachnospiraceae bacterium]